MSRPAVFLDRDGVLVEEVYYPHTGEWEAPLHVNDVRLTPGAGSGTKKLATAGFALVLVSNQGAFAKGKTTLRMLWLVHERFVQLLAAEGASLDGVFYSYSHPDGIVSHFSGPSLDRKPSPYNLMIAAAQLDLDLGNSWLIGDRDSDMSCAGAADGVRGILIKNQSSLSPLNAGTPVVQTFTDAVHYIIEKAGCAAVTGDEAALGHGSLGQ